MEQIVSLLLNHFILYIHSQIAIKLGFSCLFRRFINEATTKGCELKSSIIVSNSMEIYPPDKVKSSMFFFLHRGVCCFVKCWENGTTVESL